MFRLILILLLTLQAQALPGWKLDGLEVGQPAADLPWPHPPRHDGQFKNGPTRVQIQGGKVVTLWGSRLLTPEGAAVFRGQPGEGALKILGTTPKILYGCGKEGGQQVHFFERYQLDLTVTNGIVSDLRLYSASH